MTLPRFERIDLAIAIVGQGKMTGINTVATGSLTAAIMHPREVFMPAVIGNAVSIICGHNNPSGDLRPSDEDNGDWIFVPWLGVVLPAKIRPVHPNRGLPFETSNSNRHTILGRNAKALTEDNTTSSMRPDTIILHKEEGPMRRFVGTTAVRIRRIPIAALAIVLIGFLAAIAALEGVAQAQPATPAPAAEPIQPWGLPPLPPGVGAVEKFADISNTPQSKFLEGGAFDNQGNLWFVAIGSGWVSYLTPEGKLVPAFNCNPPAELGQTCEPQGTRWHDGKLYLTTRHRGILIYDPQTKEVKTLVYTYRNQLFKGPNDLDFDADGNLFFTDPWATGPGPNMSDRTGAIYQYSRDGVLRKVMDGGLFPNGIAVSPDNTVLAVGDCTGGRMWYAAFTNGPTMGCPQCTKDPLHLTFQGVKAGTYFPGNGCPDGIHYDVKGNLWAAAARLGGILQIDPRGLILGFVPVPNGDLVTTNFAFGGPDNQYIYLMGATSGTFWRFKHPIPV